MLSIRQQPSPGYLDPDCMTETFTDQAQQFSAIFPKKQGNI